MVLPRRRVIRTCAGGPPPPLHHHVTLAAGQIGMPGTQRLGLRQVHDPQRTLRVQPFGQRAAERQRDVLHQQDGGHVRQPLYGYGGGLQHLGLQRGGEARQAGLVHALRLGDRIHRAQGERVQRRRAALVGARGHHHHRQRPQAHESGEELQTAEAGHLDIQRKHIRREPFDLGPRLVRIRRRADHVDRW